MSLVCTVHDVSGIFDCGEPAAAIATTGCKHEHVVTDAVCAHCLQNALDGELDCDRCADALVPHSCTVVVIEQQDLNKPSSREMMMGKRGGPAVL